jgi:hypothetical protein
VTPSQYEALMAVLTEIRDRLPARRATPPSPIAVPPRVYGWAADGSEGPPSFDQTLCARAWLKHAGESQRPYLAIEVELMQRMVAAGRQAGYVIPE